MKNKEWNGKGLPPVGTVCEYLKLAKYKTSWIKVRVVFIGENLSVLEHGASGNEFPEQLADVTFRPIKTLEQIAAEERIAAIHEMLALVDIYSSLTHMLGVLYDAGYRKTEASDNTGIDWPDESRIDVIGQNGNDGKVYSEYTHDDAVGDSALSDWARWVAVDSDGEVYEYEEKPSAYHHGWVELRHKSGNINKIAPPRNFKTCIWELKRGASPLGYVLG